MPRSRRWNQPKKNPQEAESEPDAKAQNQTQENTPAVGQNEKLPQGAVIRPNRRPRKNNQPRKTAQPQGAPEEQVISPPPAAAPVQPNQQRQGRRPRRNNQGRRDGAPRENQPVSTAPQHNTQRNESPSGQGPQSASSGRDPRRPDNRRSGQSKPNQPPDNLPRGNQQRSDRPRSGQSRSNQPRGPHSEGNKEQSAVQPSARRDQTGRTQDNRRRGRQPDNRLSFPVPSVPIPTNKGIKARSQRGMFTKNWWAQRWIEAMEQLVDPHRLQRGRSYARQGQVLSLEENPYGLEARVQGSRPQPYKVTMQLTPLTDDQWDQVIMALAEQALFTAKLLAGEMPENIEDAFLTAGVSLFPDQAGDLFTSCSCPDWANPCKHVAATHYILGDRFDDDPFLLFRMRGRDQEQIMQSLRERRAGGASLDTEPFDAAPDTEISAPLSDSIEHFWEPIESLDTFPLTIRPPTVDMPLLKRLGEPAFFESASLQDVLKPVYDTFTYSALRAAYSEEEPLETNNNGHEAESASQVE